MSVNKTVREVLKSSLLLKQKKFMAMFPWANRNVILITENGSLTEENSILQITNPRKNKVTTVNVSNIVYVQPNTERRTMSIGLPNNSEIVFKADSHRLLVLWIAAIKVAMSKGTIFHVKHRSRDGIVDEDALLQFIGISTQSAKKLDQILMLSSPLDDITRHAWRISQIQQFRITDLGICIEFCTNCYRTHAPQHRSFNLFVHTSALNTCVEFICKNTHAVASDETLNSFITIYRIKNHQCPPPSTPPPPVPPVIDIRPPIPSRDHPRFGYLGGPCAKPVPKFSDLVSPYRITNKITINNDGSINQESTILGHPGGISQSNPNPLKPPRKQRNVQQPMSDKAQIFLQPKAMDQSLHRSTSVKLLPPKHIKRTDIPKPLPTHSIADMDVGDSSDYISNWLLEDYIHMHPIDLEKYQPSLSPEVKSSHNQNLNIQIVNQVSVASSSHSPSVDPIDPDRDYINIQNILIELDKSIPKSHSVTKPPIKKRTFKLLKTEVDARVTVAPNRPRIVPRKKSLSSPASPKPIPRTRTITSITTPMQKKFDFSVQEEDENVIHGGNISTEVMELTSQLDCESKSRAPPKVPFRNVKSCDNIFLADDDNVFTKDTTTQQSHVPQGYATSPSDNVCPVSPQPLSHGITTERPLFHEQDTAVHVGSTDASSSDQLAGDVKPLDIPEHNEINTSINNSGPENGWGVIRYPTKFV